MKVKLVNIVGLLVAALVFWAIFECAFAGVLYP